MRPASAPEVGCEVRRDDDRHLASTGIDCLPGLERGIDVGRDVEVRGVDQGGDEVPALRVPRLIHDHRRDVRDRRADSEPEQHQLDDRQDQHQPEGAPVPDDLEGLLVGNCPEGLAPVAPDWHREATGWARSGRCVCLWFDRLRGGKSGLFSRKRFWLEISGCRGPGPDDGHFARASMSITASTGIPALRRPDASLTVTLTAYTRFTRSRATWTFRGVNSARVEIVRTVPL